MADDRSPIVMTARVIGLICKYLLELINCSLLEASSTVRKYELGRGAAVEVSAVSHGRSEVKGVGR